jgi:hypothetical protein
MGVFEARQVAFNAFMEVLHEVVKGLVALVMLVLLAMTLAGSEAGVLAFLFALSVALHTLFVVACRKLVERDLQSSKFLSWVGIVGSVTGILFTPKSQHIVQNPAELEALVFIIVLEGIANTTIYVTSTLAEVWKQLNHIKKHRSKPAALKKARTSTP